MLAAQINRGLPAEQSEFAVEMASHDFFQAERSKAKPIWPALPQTLAPGSELAQQVAHLKLSELRGLGYIQQCVIAVQIGLAQKVPGSFAAPENVVG